MNKLRLPISVIVIAIIATIFISYGITLVVEASHNCDNIYENKEAPSRLKDAVCSAASSCPSTPCTIGGFFVEDPTASAGHLYTVPIWAGSYVAHQAGYTAGSVTMEFLSDNYGAFSNFSGGTTYSFGDIGSSRSRAEHKTATLDSSKLPSGCNDVFLDFRQCATYTDGRRCDTGTLKMRVCNPEPPPPPEPENSLSVRSRLGAGSLTGVNISSNDGLGGTTNYNINRTSDISGTLTAPSRHQGNEFTGWDNCPLSIGSSCVVNLSGGESRTITAAYKACNRREYCSFEDNMTYAIHDDTCGNVFKKQNCNVGTTCGPYGEPYCRGDNQYHKRTCTNRGCNTGSCTRNDVEQEALKEACEFGCNGGQCQPPTLFVDVNAEPSEGEEPVVSTVTAKVSGTARGPITYHIWWNCSNQGINPAGSEAECGLLPNPAPGQCDSNINGFRCNRVNDETVSAQNRYLAQEVTPEDKCAQRGKVGAYNVKAIAERDHPGDRWEVENAKDFAAVTVKPHVSIRCLVNPFNSRNIGDVLSSLVFLAVIFGAPVLIVIVISAGLMMFTGGASPKKIQTAKNMLKYAAIGYGIVLILWVISITISDLL